MRRIVVALVVAVVCLASARWSAAGDMMFGCSRPACGKMCKLVCETKALVAVGYGSTCDTICIPGPSRRGCKHCSTTCCCNNEIEGWEPKIEFCWYDWFACGCAKPRQIRLLTKYQAEQEVCSYHWEVVDGCQCCCQGGCRCVYKPAPAEAEVGDVLELSEEEQVQVASWMAIEQPAAIVATGKATSNAEVTAAAATQESQPSVWERLAKIWPASDEGE